MSTIVALATLSATLLLSLADAFVVHELLKSAPTRNLWSSTSRPSKSQLCEASATSQVVVEDEEVFDVIVIGAGIGGLSCAALSSKYGLKTLCLEAHDTPGGCAHSFSRYSSASKTVPFQFDAGPSLVTGLSSMSTNPLRQVLDAIGTANDIEWKTYDGWMIYDTSSSDDTNNNGKSLSSSCFKMTTSNGGEFEAAIEKKAGVSSRKAFEEFKAQILSDDGGLAKVSVYIPPFALRGGLGATISLLPYILKVMSIGLKGLLLLGPFSNVMDLYGLKDPFVRKWFDYLAFALSGLDASNTQGAPVAYMMSDLHKPGAVLDYPMGGMDSLVQALVSGMEQHGGELRLNSYVRRMLLKEDDNEKERKPKCFGVELSNGTIIKAKVGVVSNAPLWNYARMLEDSIEHDKNDSNNKSESSIQKAVQKVKDQANGMNMTRSFMHLHLGIPKEGLPDDLECHHSVLNFDMPVTDEQNMVIISIPTVFDPNLAPGGYHIVHAYTAASDNFDDWEQFLDDPQKEQVLFSPNSQKSKRYSQKEGYQQLKHKKTEALWKAIECVIPDIRHRANQPGSMVLVGTPLTHRRYNQRYKGAYGPGINEGKQVWELAGATTPFQNLYACGDTSFPGIGLPGVAASGTIAANTMVPIMKQWQLMKELRDKGALQ